MRRSIWQLSLSAAVLAMAACSIQGPKSSDDDDDGGSTAGECVAGWDCTGCADCMTTCLCLGGDVPLCNAQCNGGQAGAGNTSTGTGNSGTGGTPTGGTAGSGGTSTGTTGGTGGTGAAAGSGGTGGAPPGGGGCGGLGPNGCYVEGHDLNASLSDLESSYNGSQWLSTMIDVLGRRYSNGHELMSQMQSDPWLLSSFPQYFDLYSWGGLMESVDTACHEETHGWDFEAALNAPGQHAFYLGSNLQLYAPTLGFFPRSEILGYAQQGGSVTSMYDSTYLTGNQGSYDFIFLADELNAYTNGLACAVGIADQLVYGYSFRDGVAAHLLYLLYYLKHARNQYPSLYDQWKSDADWQSFIRFAWARAHYWTDVSQAFPGLGIHDVAIWNRVNDPANLVEIDHFTGQSSSVVACTP